jgi:hypothetical protein
MVTEPEDSTLQTTNGIIGYDPEPIPFTSNPYNLSS